MYINQISVFVENKPGNLAKFASFLAENGIDMRAFQIADSSDFGIVRILVPNPLDTLTLLKDNDWVCKLTQVIGIKIPDKVGAMASALDLLASEDISIDYAYTFLGRGIDDALMVFKVENNDKVAALLKKNGIKIVNQEDLAKI